MLVLNAATGTGVVPPKRRLAVLAALTADTGVRGNGRRTIAEPARRTTAAPAAPWTLPW